MAEVFVRPEMDEFTQRRYDEGRERPVPGASRSWFDTGGLGADAAGLYLIDADGVRHDLPCPPGGSLVRLMCYRITTTDPMYNLFVADEQRHRVVDLPEVGFTKVAGLDAVAAAAGLRFDEAKVNLDRVLGKGYGFPYTKETVNLDKARLSSVGRHTLRHPFGGGSRKA